MPPRIQLDARRFHYYGKDDKRPVGYDNERFMNTGTGGIS
jgi:hypothetical protein